MGRLGGRRVQDGEHVIFFLKKIKFEKKKKKHRLGGLNNHLFLTVLEAGTPMIKALADLGSSEDPLPGS